MKTKLIAKWALQEAKLIGYMHYFMSRTQCNQCCPGVAASTLDTWVETIAHFPLAVEFVLSQAVFLKGHASRPRWSSLIT